MVTVDVRMPPGWDGIETTQKLWEVDPDLQVVICSAYSDYSWDEIIAKLGNSDRLLFLKKPFDAMEILQLANALTEKWRLIAAPADVGANLTLKVALWPAVSVTGAVIPLRLNPVPLAVT